MYQVGDILEMNIDSISGKFSNWMIGDYLADAKISVEEHWLIHKLILHLHIKEMDKEKGILVFLPTYFALEEQWNHLKNFASIFEVHILHRSIDINQALQAMKASKTRRKVKLFSLQFIHINFSLFRKYHRLPYHFVEL